MVKFVASVIAGVIATVLGGLILNHLTNSQPGPSPTATPQQPFITYSTRAEAASACGASNVWQLDNGPSAGRYFCLNSN
jgi:hypothetical protein